jgi:hypothetical protein
MTEFMEPKILRTKQEIFEERKRINRFNDYILSRYKEKGKMAIESSQGLDELDTLLAIKKASKFDDEDKKYLYENQLKELERLKHFD